MCLPCLLSAAPGGGASPDPADGSPRPFPAELAALPWPDGGAALGGTVTWTGVAGFVLDLDGTRLAVDPYASRPGVLATLTRPARSDDALVARTFGRLDAVVVTHTHFDHALDLPAVVRASPAVRVHGSRTTVELCRRLGTPAGALREVRDGTRFTVGPFTVEAVASRHGHVPLAHRVDRIDVPARGLPRTPFRWPRGDVLAYRIEAGGRAIHVQGSAGIEDAALARQAPADVLIACLAARQGTPDYLGRLGAALRPGVLVPCHHDDFFTPLDRPPRPVPRVDWPGFLAEAGALAGRHGTRVVTLPRGVPVPF